MQACSRSCHTLQSGRDGALWSRRGSTDHGRCEQVNLTQDSHQASSAIGADDSSSAAGAVAGFPAVGGAIPTPNTKVPGLSSPSSAEIVTYWTVYSPIG